MKNFIRNAIFLAFLSIASVAQADGLTFRGPCSVFGTSTGTCPQGGVITGAGPTGSATVVPVITYNAAGQLTSVTTATIASPVTSASIFSTYDLTTASGTQVVSGFGFTPSACDGFGAVAGSAVGTYQTFNAHSDSALNQQAAYGNSGGTIATASVFFTATNLAGTANQIATITAYNAGSVTLTWVKTGSPTGTFVFTIRCFK